MNNTFKNIMSGLSKGAYYICSAVLCISLIGALSFSGASVNMVNPAAFSVLSNTMAVIAAAAAAGCALSGFTGRLLSR